MQSLSVIIVCKNEAAIIGRTLQALEGLTDDVIVYDNGSTDNTIAIAKQYKAKVFQGEWEGYGKTKQKTVSLARYDWVLSLDADEVVEPALKKTLLTLQLSDEKKIYALRRKNFLNDKHLKYGEWGSDIQNRLFNRSFVNWDDAEVHETLVIPAEGTIVKLAGAVLHQTMKDVADYSQKTVNYAVLSAAKYFRKGKRSNWVKIRIAPGFTFFKYYILKVGFLDGHYGYICARMAAYYTFLKYTLLKELEQQNKEQ